MHVVLEGPDGAGKTTLSQAIMKRYGVEAVHNGPPAPGQSASSLVREYAADVSMPNPGGLVVDRWALGETVYGPLFRGGSLVTLVTWRALVGLLDATETPLVVCVPPKSVAMANWRQRREAGGEQFTDDRLVGLAYDKYADYAYATASHYVRPRWMWVHDYTRENWDALWGFLDGMKDRQ